MTRIDDTRPFLPVRIAVLTVSDTRTAADDRSGDTLAERITSAGHILSARALLPDDRARIAGQLRAWIADPRAIKPGALMPAMKLPADQLDRLAAYLATLR